MKKINLLLAVFAIIFLTGWGPFDFLQRSIQFPAAKRAWADKQIRLITAQNPTLDQYVLRLSLKAYLIAKQKGMYVKDLMTIIDYSKPSIERRLWVIDLKNAKVLINTWVAHGRNSGKISPNSFSNELGSLKSSLGVFLTTKTPYIGLNGYSLRLIGLERGINDLALARAIVVHGAPYANPNVLKKYGGLGRSWGCPAVSDTMAKPLINKIKDQSLVFVYYPDRHWINNSQFLAG